jgi:Lon protease-like protein
MTGNVFPAEAAMTVDPALEAFDGVARLFPLPNLVLFPHVVQGLHLFEPRYRHLAADTLAGDGLFALAVLKPGWESDYDGAPALESYACLGHVLRHEKLPDGRYNLHLRGVTRIRLHEEIETDSPYRLARSTVVPDVLSDDVPALAAARKALAAAVFARVESPSGTHKQLTELFASESPLGHVCDVLAYALPLSHDLKYSLLAEARPLERAAILTNALGAVRTGPRKFPPEFSIN